jgi:hypothetical protein
MDKRPVETLFSDCEPTLFRPFPDLDKAFQANCVSRNLPRGASRAGFFPNKSQWAIQGLFFRGAAYSCSSDADCDDEKD